jgi:hypothetical protein
VYFRVVSVNPSIYMRAAGPNWVCALFHYLPQFRLHPLDETADSESTKVNEITFITTGQ